MTAERVISVPDIWSVLALGVGGFSRYCFFPLSWWPVLQISCCRPHYFITEGDLRRACVACFSLYYLTFLWQRLTCSKVKVLCSARQEKLNCGYISPSLKCHCCMMYHTRRSINKGGLKMSQAFNVQSHHFIHFGFSFIYAPSELHTFQRCLKG